MKKLLILGCTGMLGSGVLKVFSDCKNFSITATYKDYRSLKQLKRNKLTAHKIRKIKFARKLSRIVKKINKQK